MAANGERVDRGDPKFFRPASVHVVGDTLRRGDAAQELMHIAEVADQKPKEGDLAEIEMGEIDARAKNALAPIFLVVHRNAAHDRDLGRPVERRDVDGELRLGKSGVVLGVEKARIDHFEMRRLAAAREARGAEVERAAFGEFRQ